MSSRLLTPTLCVSLGPGDPELMTVGAVNALMAADTIFCPGTLMPGGRSVSRAGDLLAAIGIDEARIRPFLVPMDPDRSRAEAVYEAVAGEIARQYRSGASVAFVAEGDAGFYSSVHYIADRLAAARIPVRRLAGVPAFIACGALAGIHLAKQEEPLTVFPAAVEAEAIAAEAMAGRTVVLMKLSQQADAVRRLPDLLADVQFHYFENAGVPEREFYTTDVDEIRRRPYPYFSILIIRR